MNNLFGCKREQFRERFTVKKANMQSQVRIDNFKKEKKTARSAASRVGRVFGYIFSALVTLMLVCLVTGIIVACVFSIYVIST